MRTARRQTAKSAVAILEAVVTNIAVSITSAERCVCVPRVGRPRGVAPVSADTAIKSTSAKHAGGSRYVSTKYKKTDAFSVSNWAGVPKDCVSMAERSGGVATSAMLGN